jgi:hypothetical protein
MKNAPFVKAFQTIMARTGKPVTAVAQQATRGRPKQLFQLEDGPTILVRTNEKPALMTRQAGDGGRVLPIDAPLAFEPYDFVAAVHRHPNHPDRAVVYLIPSPIAAAEMKRLQKLWIEADSSHDKDNRIFLIRFDDAPARGGWHHHHGYGAKWAKYRIGEVELSTIEEPRLEETGEPVQALLDRHREQIADALGVLPEAIKISVNLLYEDKNGRTRSTFIR